MEHFPHLNEFCAAGAAAAVRRRQERERREELMARGVFTESAMFPEDGGVVEVGWLEEALGLPNVKEGWAGAAIRVRFQGPYCNGPLRPE